ncbi:hypothetical protein EMEDMD4_910053 [Sinorhizobium medicae]|uniref:Uncharacterized protein n=1 Tax=Sinorhizobium medicae TaxID=110321 RepID=A0A508X7J0_9HYPH|nr:hypothetical protein EMEDMD4_910053 [Sinorhizobium medicae]
MPVAYLLTGGSMPLATAYRVRRGTGGIKFPEMLDDVPDGVAVQIHGMDNVFGERPMPDQREILVFGSDVLAPTSIASAYPGPVRRWPERGIVPWSSMTAARARTRRCARQGPPGRPPSSAL